MSSLLLPVLQELLLDTEIVTGERRLFEQQMLHECIKSCTCVAY